MFNRERNEEDVTCNKEHIVKTDDIELINGEISYGESNDFFRIGKQVLSQFSIFKEKSKTAK